MPDHQSRDFGETRHATIIPGVFRECAWKFSINSHQQKKASSQSATCQVVRVYGYPGGLAQPKLDFRFGPEQVASVSCTPLNLSHNLRLYHGELSNGN